MNDLIEKVKLAMWLTDDAHDDEIEDLIYAACLDLGIAGIPTDATNLDALQRRAVITYVRAHFGSPDDYDKLTASYDEQKAQMQVASGYGLPEV